jgi:L-2-hydroxycarboxylate dehydrogenase (NAD+)
MKPASALDELRPVDGHQTPGRAEPPDTIVRRDALLRFVAAVLRAAGLRPSDARVAAEVLVLADARGHPSHGVSRLRQYVRLLATGSVRADAQPKLVAHRGALESWDADRAMGQVIGTRIMDRMIRRARRTGIGLAVVRDAGHFGIAGAYVLRAMEQDMIGIAMCTGSPTMAPTGGRSPVLGTNPIAIGAPDGAGRGFLLDMATSVVAVGKVEVAARRGTAIPAAWALDRDGQPTTDPRAALDGVMLPLGGEMETGGYKGYGLAAAVDLLTGVLGGGSSLSAVAGLWDSGHPTTISQTYLALDPSALGDVTAFQARLRAWHDELVSQPRRPGVAEIQVAGDPEWASDARQQEHIQLVPSVAADLANLAGEAGLLGYWRRVPA